MEDKKDKNNKYYKLSGAPSSNGEHPTPEENGKEQKSLEID